VSDRDTDLHLQFILLRKPANSISIKYGFSILRSSFRRKSGIPNNTSYYLSPSHFIMADRIRPHDKEKWKKELEEAGFSHCGKL
jgi:hypothetical protein